MSRRKETDGKNIEKLYTNPSNPGAFSGEAAFVRSLKNKKINKDDVKKFLESFEPYTIYKPICKKFMRRRVVVPQIDHTWQADLVDVSKYADENDGYKFLLTCIDVFSKYAWAVPLKNKSGKTVTEAFNSIYGERKCEKLQVDKGSEFYNKEFLSFCKNNKIAIYSTQSELKACVVERFNRTLREKMHRYFSYADNNKYIDIIQDLLKSYNNSYHRSIKCTPISINSKSDQNKIYQNLYKYRKEDGNKSEIRLLFKKGDKIRVSKSKRTFEKGYTPNYTIEIFTIDKVLPTVPPTYVIKDLQGEEINGTFYEQEIQKISESTEPIYRIEKIIKKKKEKNITKYYVKWLDYPDKFNSWINEQDLK
jgi:transposase InsO family protein